MTQAFKVNATPTYVLLDALKGASYWFIEGEASYRILSSCTTYARTREPECGAFMRTPKTNCDMKSVDLAYNRLHNAIRTAQMCRVRKGSGYG